MYMRKTADNLYKTSTSRTSNVSAIWMFCMANDSREMLNVLMWGYCTRFQHQGRFTVSTTDFTIALV